MKPLTHGIGAGFLVLAGLAAIGPAAGARPEYHEQFLADPLRNAEAEGCGVCHQDTAGGGPRGDFGEQFEAAGLVITPMMRASFPELFDVPEAPIGERGTLRFLDSDNRSAIVEMDGETFVIDLPEGVLNVVGEDETEEETIGPRVPGKFSFFVTSVGLRRGGNLGGIAGADLHCQSLADGTASTLTFENWTADDEGQTVLGHFDRQGGGDNGSSWNSAHPSAGCSQQAFESTGGDGLFYCFAID